MTAGPKPLSHISTIRLGSFLIELIMESWEVVRLVAGLRKEDLLRARVRLDSKRESRFSRAGGPGLGCQSLLT